MLGLRSTDLELALSGAAGGVTAVAVSFVIRRSVGVVSLALGVGAVAAAIHHYNQHILVTGLTAERVAPAATAAALAAITCWLIRHDEKLLDGAAAALVIAAGAVWTAVPETRTVLVVGAMVATTAVGIVVLRRPARLALLLASVALALSVATGYSYSARRAAGAAMALGLLVLWPLGQALRAAAGIRFRARGTWWLLIVHAVCCGLAARWIAVDPDPELWRFAAVAVLGAGASAVAAPRPRHVAGHGPRGGGAQ
jgi:hypothetical protein